MDTPPPPLGFRFDHLNLRTTDQDSDVLQRLFGAVMGLRDGYRPPFPFPRQWLYGAPDNALLHVVYNASTPHDALQLAHIAFRTDEQAKDVLARLQSNGLSHAATQSPDGDVQIFVPLPGGLVIELNTAH
ncbi:MAG TPA: hypothetical protein VF513_03605 [Stenotrophomonas sp.]